MSNESTAVATQEDTFDVEGTAIQPYRDRSEVYEIAKRLMNLHPAAQEVGNRGMLAVAQCALMIGANPLPGTNEIHVWKNNRNQVQLQLGINYHRRRARELGGVLWRIRPRLMNDTELEQYEIKESDLAAICEGVRREDMLILTKAGLDANTVWDVAGEVGIGTVDRGERPKQGRPLSWTALKRAETDCYRRLFPNLEQPDDGTAKWRQILDTADEMPFSIVTPGAPADRMLDEMNRVLDREDEVLDERDQALPAEPATRGRNKLFKTAQPLEAIGEWVEYPVDEMELDELHEALDQENEKQPAPPPPPPDFLTVEVPSDKHKNKTIGWLLDNDRAYLERIANEAHDVSLRESAQAALEWQNEAQPPLIPED